MFDLIESKLPKQKFKRIAETPISSSGKSRKNVNDSRTREESTIEIEHHVPFLLGT